MSGNSATGLLTLTNGTFSKTSLEELWVDAGGSKSKAPLMAAIALAESSGDPHSESPVLDEGSHAQGLWQIEMPMHSSQVPGGDAFDPLANAEGAVAILNSQGLKAWQTYTEGTYKQFLGGASADTSSEPAASQASAEPSTADNPLVPEKRGSGKALEILLYALLFALGISVTYLGVTRATRGTGEA